jgi:hypothetical protein
MAVKNHSASLCELVSQGEYRVRNFDGSLRPVDIMLVPVGFLSLPDFERYANDVGVSVELMDAAASGETQSTAPTAMTPKRRRRKRPDEFALEIAKVVEAIGTHETMPVWIELMKRAERKEGCLLGVDDGIHWATARGKREERVASFNDVSDRLGRMYAGNARDPD